MLPFFFFRPHRKDPFASSQNGNSNTSGTEGTIYGQAIRKETGTVSTTIGTNIQNPHWFSWYSLTVSGTGYGNCPNKTPYYNSWSAKNTTVQNQATSTDNIVVKTIYDPCPVGYTVAPVNAFSGMTDTKGWSSTDIGSLQQGCWFPATGRRNYGSGVPEQVGTFVEVWQAVPFSANYARDLFLRNSTSMGPAISRNRSIGVSVRPVEEIKEKN